MKTWFLLLLVLPVACYAQQFVLLDRDFIRPVIVTDQVSAELITERRFPVYSNDFDALIHFAERLQKQIHTGKIYEGAAGSFTVGNSWFVAQREKIGRVNKYNITLNTRVHDLGASLELVSHDDGSKTALKKINIFLDYLRNNKVLIEDAFTQKH